MVFFARLGPFIVYALGVSVARVLVFAVGWGCQMVLALTPFGLK